jgi:CheY-like chemotaxis protein
MIRLKKVTPVKPVKPSDPEPDIAALVDPAADISVDPVGQSSLVDLVAETAVVDPEVEWSLLDPVSESAVLDPETLSALNGDVDIALVDDDPVIGVMIKRVLVSKGYSVTWFEDGLAAVAAMCKPNVSVRAKLILLDVSMPGLGGWGVLHYLSRDGVLDTSRVIMLTASTSEQDVRQAIGLGATGYLAKPLNIRLLIQRVKRALGR